MGQNFPPNNIFATNPNIHLFRLKKVYQIKNSAIGVFPVFSLTILLDTLAF